MATLERMVIFTILAVLFFYWLSPIRVETKTSVDSQGAVEETTTITVNYWEEGATPTPSAAP